MVEKGMEVDMEEDGVEEFCVDFEYEYDAPMFFDFCRGESDAEARVSERWFESAAGNPPSPYVVKLIERESLLMESTHPAIVNQEAGYGNGRYLYNINYEFSQVNKSANESNSMEFMAKKVSKSKSKNIMKTYTLQSSTLMKPTASHLAKQNLARGSNASVRLAQRFDVPLAFKAQHILEKPTVTDNQASKRQKLEGGLLCKVPHMQEQSNWTHKAAKKNVLIVGHPELPRPKLTIPREPELVTARRALRMRSNLGSEVEHASLRTQSFKARPLNRKIFEPSPMLFRQKSTPRLPVFQEFHLKTSERARQHVSAAPLMHLARRNIDHKVGQKSGTAAFDPGRVIQSKKMQCPHVQYQRFQIREDEETMHNFNSHRLRKKNFSNDGVYGNFVTRKPPLATTLMESEAYNDERLHQKSEAYNDERLPQILASELFSKLSLSDINQTSRLEVKTLKENVSDSLNEGFKASQSIRNGLPCNGRVERILSEIRL